MDNLDTIRIFNSLKDEFPRVKDIFSIESEFGGSLETFIFDEGGEMQFYLTKIDQDNYIPRILSYYALSQIMHILDSLDRADYNIPIDRSNDLVKLNDDHTYYVMELIPNRGDITSEVWNPIWEIVRILNNNLRNLNYKYLGLIPRA